MLSKMEMDSTAMQATISDDMLEVLTRVVITNRKGGGRKERKFQGRVGELRNSRLS
jgi:hypothetical protein